MWKYKLKYISYFLTFVLTIFCSSCKKSTEPIGSNNPPPGYQEDISWPSLADSPWPMYRCDPQGTGRSKGLGPQFGVIEWLVDTLNISTGIAIGNDSTIYCGVIGNAGKNYSALIALNQDGSIKWQYELSPHNIWLSSPIVSSEDIIYISDHMADKFHAVKSDGSTNWAIDLDSRISQTGINIGKDGTIYIVGSTNNVWTLYAVSKQGQILWSIDNIDIAGDEINGMSFSADGKTLYIPGDYDGPGLTAIDIETRSVKWEFGFARLTLSGAPVIDSKGNIYVISSDEEDNGFLYCLDGEKNIRWSYSLGPFDGWVSNFNLFALDKLGNIYLGLDEIISLDYEGQFRWSFQVSNVTSPIVIDNSNNIYFTNKMGEEKELICIAVDGNVVYSISYPESKMYSCYSPGIGYGKMYIPGYKTSLISSIY
jgi:hypothetical protein